MYILVDSNCNVCSYSGNNCEYGIWEETFKKWKLTNDVCIFYVIGDYFKCFEVDSLPSDYVDGKYCYTTEKGFYLNENYNEPIDPEEEVRRLVRENIDLKSQLGNVQEVLDYLVMQ